VALSSRSVASSRADPAQHSVPRPNIASTNITFCMEQPHFYLPVRQLLVRAVLTLARKFGIESWAHQDNLDLSKSGSGGLSKNAHLAA
jgi:hypothetical protein